MEAPFAALDTLMARSCMNLLADAVVTRASGAQFLARRFTEDASLFEGRALAQDLSLKIITADAADIAPGEQLSVDGVAFEVVGDPRRVDAQESLLQLVELI